MRAGRGRQCGQVGAGSVGRDWEGDRYCGERLGGRQVVREEIGSGWWQ